MVLADRSGHAKKEFQNDITFIWAEAQQFYNFTCEDSDQPAHPRSLIRVFAGDMKKVWVFCYP